MKSSKKIEEEFGINEEQKELFYHSIKAVGALNSVFPNHKESVYLKEQLTALFNKFDFNLNNSVAQQVINYLVQEH